jgi:hypothetical protein
MTQKSKARQQRDAVAKNAQAQGVQSMYAVLNDMYAQQCGMFSQYARMIELVSHDEIVPHLKNRTRTEGLLRGMSVDIEDLLAKTAAVHRQHAHTTGWPDPKDEDVHYTLMQLQQSYIMYLNVHQQNIMPVMFELDENLQYALRAKEQAQVNQIASATASNAVIQQAQASAAAQTQPPVPSASSYETPAI